jgi:hypothetical protein
MASSAKLAFFFVDRRSARGDTRKVRDGHDG